MLYPLSYGRVRLANSLVYRDLVGAIAFRWGPLFRARLRSVCHEIATVSKAAK